MKFHVKILHNLNRQYDLRRVESTSHDANRVFLSARVSGSEADWRVVVVVAEVVVVDWYSGL